MSGRYGNGEAIVMRRSTSLPLDPTPQPLPYLVTEEQAQQLQLLGTGRSSAARTEPPTEFLEEAEATTDTNHHPENGAAPRTTSTSTSTPSKKEKEKLFYSTQVTDSTTFTPVEDDDERGRGWGRGIVRDFKSTVGTWWCAEMINFNQKTVAVSFFLFFACIAPAITFGAVYGKATHNRIGAVEMIIATAWCGIVYALIGGQPMMINGGTGPVLAFTEILYKMSERIDVPFLTFNAWIGIWIGFYMIVAATCSLNRIIEYATRFTDEIFALLIATIFIINALGSPFSPTGIYYYFEEDHKSHEMYQDEDDYSHTATAFLSLIVCIGTVQVAFLLRRVKFSPFMPGQMWRNVVTDFAVVTSIIVWTLIAGLAFGYVPLETLNVPSTVAPTFACCTDACDSSWPEDCPEQETYATRRPWLVSLNDLNGKSWVPIMAAGPALLAFILVFLDDGITWHLINHPAHKLTHGSAYDYDTVIIGVMIVVNAMFGLPILVAATVRSQNHVHAMAEKSPDGRIESVQETRLTHLFIHVLCLVSLFALDALKLIPMPVLYGVFLFMGLVSLGSNTLWGRFLMFFMQPSKYPLEPYTIHMRPRRMHLFTLIQLSLFALLYTVKAIKTIAIAFPLIIALCIPFRLYVLPRIFTEKELIMIDGDDSDIKKWLEVHGYDDDESGDGDKKMGPDDKGSSHPDEEGDGEPVLMADIKKSPEHTAEDEKDLEQGEAYDLAQPLPTAGEVSDKPRRRSRGRRKKASSCPSPHLFWEMPYNNEAAPAIGQLVVVQEEEPSETTSQPSEDQQQEEVIGSSLAPQSRRPRRRKTVSCPPTHLLFSEADRQIAGNYFFG